MADRYFQCPSVSLALAYSKRKVPVYKYRWNHILDLPHFLRLYRKLGVFHFSEVPMIFTQKAFLFGEERILARIANNAWTSFAARGVPDMDYDELGDYELWPLYSEKNKRANVVFQTPIISMYTESDERRDEKCSLWKAIERKRE
jgi:carboxylesterase type B